MYAPQRGRRSGGRKTRSISSRSGRTSIVRSLSFLVLAGSLTTVLKAQSTSPLDCSDPLLASTSECSSQSQQGTQPQTEPGAQGGYNPLTGNPPGNPNYPGSPNYNGNLPSSYSDIERYERQAGARPTPLQPEPLTEFQKFVASTTDLVLPVYGANLFRRIPSTFAPVDMAPVPSDYVVGPGDELRIRIWGQVNLAGQRSRRPVRRYLSAAGRTSARCRLGIFRVGCASARSGGPRLPQL